MRYIPVLLLIAVFAAGCVQQLPTFGLDAISIVRDTSVEGERNVLVITDKLTIPKSPVLTDQSVQFSFLLENKDVAKPAKQVEIDLFDAPLMKNPDGRLCTVSGTKNCVPRGCSPGQRCFLTDLLPGEQRQVLFDMFSPTQGQIGGIKTDLKMNLLVRYNFEGSTSFTVPVVNVNEILARQRAGDKIKVDVVKSIGSGPIQVDPELFGSAYILSGQSGTFLFVVKNQGKGNLPESKVPSRKLCLYFPTEFFGSSTYLTSPDGIGYCADGSIKPKDGACPLPGSVPGFGAAIIAKIAPGLLTEKPLITGYATDGTDEPPPPEQPASPAKPECSCEYDIGSDSSYCTSVCGSKAGQACKTVDECRESQKLFNCVHISQAPEGLDCLDRTLKDKIVCYNERPIELFRDESRTSMRFSIHKIKELSEPFRSMTLLANIKYPYELRDSFEVTVIPAKE